MTQTRVIHSNGLYQVQIKWTAESNWSTLENCSDRDIAVDKAKNLYRKYNEKVVWESGATQTLRDFYTPSLDALLK
jgi:hypothetical protein